MSRDPVILVGGRVVDPEGGRDGSGDVALLGDAIVPVPAAGPAERIDVRGLVVCPGFIDLHSHGQAIPEQRLQVLDGVTTALELEAGAVPVSGAYARAAAQGRPVNYGFSTSWALSRMIELAGAPPGAFREALSYLGGGAWHAPATAPQRAAVLGRLRADLEAGALGVGVLAGYAPLLDPSELLDVARLAAEFGVPVFTHARALIEVDPDVPVDGAEELVRAAGETGAHMHYCHINSTSLRHIDRVLDLVERAKRAGARITTEAYPYGAGSTAIGATFLEPSRLHLAGLRPDDIIYLPTGERVPDARRLAELRAADPGGLAILDFFDESDPADRAVLERGLLHPGTAIASDAMPLTWLRDPPDPMTWPLPAGAIGHPRGAGTFTKALRTLALPAGPLSLSEVIGRCTLEPARILGDAVPAMARKGRLRPGFDADVVVLDPDRVSDRATYADGTRPSEGVVHVFVNGRQVVRDGELVQQELPGRPVRRGASPAA
jgi:dihydroorotase-like cyclic amidohydrolase